MTPVTDEKAAAMRSRMAELSGKFVERTGDEVETMRARLAEAGRGNADALREIVNLAHRASGTGATLGLESLSARARRIELLAAGLTPGVAPDAAVMAELSAAIEALAAELRRSRGDH